MSYMNDMEVAYNEKPVCFNYHSYLNAVSDVARLTTENEALKARWNSLYERCQTKAFDAVSQPVQRAYMSVVTDMDELAGDISEVQHE